MHATLVRRSFGLIGAALAASIGLAGAASAQGPGPDIFFHFDGPGGYDGRRDGRFGRDRSGPGNPHGGGFNRHRPPGSGPTATTAAAAFILVAVPTSSPRPAWSRWSNNIPTSGIP